MENAPLQPPLDTFESTWHRATMGVVSDVLVERANMLSRWGDPSYPSLGCDTVKLRAVAYAIPTPERARKDTEELRASGLLDWATICVQSVTDAVHAPDERRRREEVVQIAAVALAWVEDIDRRRRAKAATAIPQNPTETP